MLALLPPGILRLAVAAPLPLPGVGRPRVLLRRLLLGIVPTLLLLPLPQRAQGVPRQREFHPPLFQTLREISHESVDLGFPEQLLWLLPANTPADGELDSSLPVVMVIQGHQLSERQTPLGCLGPDIFPAEALVRQVQPGGLRHLAVGNLRHVV